MILLLSLLICTVVGWLCGSALIGLGAGFVLAFVLGWVASEPEPRRRRRSRR